MVEFSMLDPSALVLTLTFGVAIGCIYVLLATGLNLIFGVMKLVNFAHGEFIMIGAYIGFTTITALGVNAYVALLITIPAVALIGIAVERFVFRKIMGTDKLNEILASLGLIFIFDNAAVLIWGDKTKQRLVSPFEDMSIKLGESFGGASVRVDWIIAIIFVIATLIVLVFLIKKTKIGMAMRATSQKSQASMLMGINIERIYIFTFAVGAALAGAAGVLYGIIFPFNPYIGALPTIKSFAIIILGGLGSIPGAIIGGLLYGVAEQVTVVTLGSIWRNAVAFSILIIVLVLRPEGLFGKKGE